MSRMLAIAVLLLTVEYARADVGPFLPFSKNARVAHRIEAAESFPDHVFVVHRHGIKGEPDHREYNEATFESLGPASPIRIRPEIHEDVTLMLVPRAEATAYPTAAELASAVFGNRVPLAASHRFDWRTQVPSWGDGEVTITYRVQRNRSGDGLELVRTSRAPLWQWNVAALCLALAFVLGGLWAVRRLWRSVRSGGTPAPGTTPA